MQDLRRCLRVAQACQRAVVARVPRPRAGDSTMLQQANGRAPRDCDRRAPHPARAATRKEQRCSRRSQAEAHVGSNVRHERRPASRRSLLEDVRSMEWLGRLREAGLFSGAHDVYLCEATSMPTATHKLTRHRTSASAGCRQRATSANSA